MASFDGLVGGHGGHRDQLLLGDVVLSHEAPQHVRGAVRGARRSPAVHGLQHLGPKTDGSLGKTVQNVQKHLYKHLKTPLKSFKNPSSNLENPWTTTV